MGGQSAIKNPRRIFSQLGGDSTLPSRVTILENNEYKITYFTEISSSAGTITIPTGATILLDQFQGGVDAYVTTIQNGQPTGVFPQTGLGVAVDVTSFNSLGDYTLSDTPSSYPVALIYILKIKAIDYSNLVITNILDLEDIGATGTQNKIFINTNDSATHTGTLTNTIIWSEDISNKLNSGDISEVISQIVRVSGSTAATIRYYLSSSESLSGATQIGIYLYGFSGLNIADFRRQLVVKSSTLIRVNATTSSTLNDYFAASNYADVTVDLTSLHIIFAIALGNTSDQFLVSSRQMIK
jgi:hypothetical protein